MGKRPRRSAKTRETGTFAFVLYSLLAIAAFWYPFGVAIVTMATWVFWLALGIRHEKH